MRYGLPYKGSKNKIIPFLMSQFPKKTHFIDLFCGGCAVTHGAMLSGKFETFTVNDISDYPSVFLDAIGGKYANEKRWISREDFFQLKDNDPYIRYCWSFGNNGFDYLYSKEVEPWKKALHYACVLNDFSLLEAFGIKTDKADRITVARNVDDWKKKYLDWAKKYFDFTQDEIEKFGHYKKKGVFDNLIHGSVGLAQLKKRLRSLQRLQRLEVLRGDYKTVPILPDSLVYCDIPYKGTNGYKGGFNHAEFYEWARKQKELVIISEYSMPEDFICITQIKKSVSLCSGSGKKAVEKLFIPKHQKDLWERVRPKETLFDD